MMKKLFFTALLAALTLQVNAVMHPNTYTLHFVSETGTQDVQQVYGTPVTLPAASEKKHYDFVSWYNSDGTVAQDGEIYLRLGDSTYTAQYTKQFPMTAVIALSAAIVLIALYLVIARIAENRRKKAAEKAAQPAENTAGSDAPKTEE
jgi:predicted small secreted protein